MPWGRIEDDLHQNGKVLSFTDKEYRVWSYAISFCNAKRAKQPDTYDELTPAEVLAVCRLAEAPANVLSGLVGKRGLDRTETGYRVHDLRQYGPASAAERQRKHRHNGHGPNVTARDISVTERDKSVTQTVTENVTHARDAHVRPVPDPVPVDASTTPVDPLEDTSTGEVLTLAVAPSARSQARPVPKQTQGVPKPHQAMIAALGQSLGEPRTKGDWGKYASAAADLCRAGAVPEDVPKLVERWDELYAGATCTPFALSNNYASLTSDRKRATGKARRDAPESWDTLREIAAERGVEIRPRTALEAG